MRQWGVVVVLMAACEATVPKPPLVNGSAVFVDVAPANRPSMIGSYDFDLLGQGAGQACANRGSSTTYWIGMNDLSELSADALSKKAIAAAAHDAMSRIEDEVDTLLITSVFVMAKTEYSACATVRGRGVRLKKAVPRIESPDASD